jgi:hypothetical protein
MAETFLPRPIARLHDEALVISCDTCTMYDTPACGDCVVSFICGREPSDAVVIDVEEARALRVLQQAGLVPHLRHARG